MDKIFSAVLRLLNTKNNKAPVNSITGAYLIGFWFIV